MPIVEFGSKVFTVDQEGHLLRFNDWDPEWVEYVRTAQRIPVLTHEHWKLIGILQEYYKKHGEPPLVRTLSRETGFKMKHIFELFPAGPGKGACKIAGLPKPKGCV
jgi:dissimilatory sulfite reductase related protein